jgi:hypothetical protein
MEETGRDFTGKIGGSLLENSFFGHVDPRRAEDVLKPCPMGGASKVHSVSGVVMYPVLGAGGKGGQSAGYAPFIINAAFVFIAVSGKTSPA